MPRQPLGRLSATAAPGLVLVLVLALPARAEDEKPWTWPEKPQNLQVFPKDWPGARLRAPMTGFARALGVRCSHCHVGEPDKPLATYDFVSDANPNKERAREMLRMLGSINEHLGKIEPSGDQRVNMWCHTCHRGRPRPMTLGEELVETYRAAGKDAALARLTELKASYLGKGVYNFDDESALNELGYAALEHHDTAGAIEIFTLATEDFPESINAWDSLAEAHLKAGHLDQAKQCYESSLELDPGNQQARDMLLEISQREGQ